MGTIYQCCKEGKDVNKTPIPIHCEDTESDAIKWLEDNGGGIYRNILHRIQFKVEPITNRLLCPFCHKEVLGLANCFHCGASSTSRLEKYDSVLT